MKKILPFLITVSTLCTAGAFTASAAPTPEPAAQSDVTAQIEETTQPEETESPEETAQPSESPEPTLVATVQPTLSPTPAVPERELSTEFNLTIDVTSHKHIIANNAFVELYSEDGELLGSQHRYVGYDTPSVTMVFEVPEYRMGTNFKVKLVSGLRSLKYYDSYVEPGGTLDVQTYGYLDENGVYAQANGCIMTGNPEYDKELRIYAGGEWHNNLSPRARLIDGVSMMPVRAIGEAMGLKVTYDPNYDSVVCSVGSDQVIFNANSAYTTVFGTDTYSPHAAVYIDGSLFVPIRTLAEAFGSTLEVADYGEYMDILIGESPMVTAFRNQTPVNRNGISSSTNYLVWVSKSEYKVRVYEGSQYQWELLKEFPCALGAWNTPTITGQFEYIERTQWNYSGYYVGPVLRFYNGYALHSTLLYYNGTEYDGRVGVNISHGCVRLHPQDINWIANTIPLRTKIYITE